MRFEFIIDEILLVVYILAAALATAAFMLLVFYGVNFKLE